MVKTCPMCGKTFGPSAGEHISLGMHMKYKHDPIMNAKIRKRKNRKLGNKTEEN